MTNLHDTKACVIPSDTLPEIAMGQILSASRLHGTVL